MKHNDYGHNLHVRHIGDGTKHLSRADIPEGKAAIVVMNMHGGVTGRKEFDSLTGKTKAQARSGLFKENEKEVTIHDVLAINEKLKPSHFDIISCHNGALIHNIEDNLDQFEEGTSFTILSGSKHAVQGEYSKKYIENSIEEYSKNPDKSMLTHFAQDVQKNPDTKIFVQVTKNKVSGEKSLVAIKAIGPKNEIAYQKLLEGEFFGSVAEYDSDGKSHQKSNLVLMKGSKEDKAFEGIISEMKGVFDKDYDTFIYKYKLFPVAAAHGNFEMVKFISEKTCSTGYSTEAVYKALFAGHLDVFQYLLDHYPRSIENYKKTLDNMSIHESGECFNWLYQKALEKGENVDGLYEKQLDMILENGNQYDLKKFFKFFPMDLFKQEDILKNFMESLEGKSDEIRKEAMNVLKEADIDLSKFKEVSDTTEQGYISENNLEYLEEEDDIELVRKAFEALTNKDFDKAGQYVTYKNIQAIKNWVHLSYHEFDSKDFLNPADESLIMDFLAGKESDFVDSE